MVSRKVCIPSTLFPISISSQTVFGITMAHPPKVLAGPDLEVLLRTDGHVPSMSFPSPWGGSKKKNVGSNQSLGCFHVLVKLFVRNWDLESRHDLTEGQGWVCWVGKEKERTERKRPLLLCCALLYSGGIQQVIGEALERRQDLNARTESLIQVNENKNREMDKEMLGQTKWTKELRPHTILTL